MIRVPHRLVAILLVFALQAPARANPIWNYLRVRCLYSRLVPGAAGKSSKQLQRILGVGEAKAQFRNARSYVLGMAGGTEANAKRRAEMLHDLLNELSTETNGEWRFDYAIAADGAHVFKARDLPLAIIVRPTDGAIFQGEPEWPRSSWYPPYGNPRKLTRFLPGGPPR